MHIVLMCIGTKDPESKFDAWFLIIKAPILFVSWLLYFQRTKLVPFVLIVRLLESSAPCQQKTGLYSFDHSSVQEVVQKAPYALNVLCPSLDMQAKATWTMRAFTNDTTYLNGSRPSMSVETNSRSSKSSLAIRYMLIPLKCLSHLHARSCDSLLSSSLLII